MHEHKMVSNKKREDCEQKNADMSGGVQTENVILQG